MTEKQNIEGDTSHVPDGAEVQVDDARPPRRITEDYARKLERRREDLAYLKEQQVRRTAMVQERLAQKPPPDVQFEDRLMNQDEFGRHFCVVSDASLATMMKSTFFAKHAPVLRPDDQLHVWSSDRSHCHILVVKTILCLPDEIICGHLHTQELTLDEPSHEPSRELAKQLNDPQAPMEAVSAK